MTKHTIKVSHRHGGVSQGDPYVLNKNEVASIYKAAKAWGVKHPNPISWRKKK